MRKVPFSRHVNATFNSCKRHFHTMKVAFTINESATFTS